MKWFKHFSDAYSNLKHQQVISEFGLKGYGFYWLCLELLAQQGEKNRIRGEKKWKKVLAHIAHESEEETGKLLALFAEVRLIDKKALERGDLCIPQISEYSDEYTAKLRRVSGQRRDKVVLEEEGEEEGEEEQKREGKLVTPAMIARDFFALDENSPALEEFVSTLQKKYPLFKNLATEIKKFRSYWTERNKTGKRERWELRETFEVNRRLATWLSRAGGIGPPSRSRGKEIVGLSNFKT